MPRYHFNVLDGTNHPDIDGHELPDLATAKQESVRLAAALLREHADKFWGGEEWRMEVAGEDGATLFKLRFLAEDA